MNQQQPAPFVLASLLTSYPTPDVEESARVLIEDADVKMSDELRSLILKRTAGENLEDLQSEYIDIFDRGRCANPIYETEYGRHRVMAKGNELADIAGFYRAFGFELDANSENNDMLDHVGIELEFYALMLMKQMHLSEINDHDGANIVEDGRKKFLSSHLGRFVRAICSRPGVQESEFYSQILNWSADLIEQECKDLKLDVDQVTWLDDQQSKEEDMNCAVKRTT